MMIWFFAPTGHKGTLESINRRFKLLAMHSFISISTVNGIHVNFIIFKIHWILNLIQFKNPQATAK